MYTHCKGTFLPLMTVDEPRKCERSFYEVVSHVGAVEAMKFPGSSTLLVKSASNVLKMTQNGTFENA